MHLTREAANGKVLAPDIPAVNIQVGVSGTEKHMHVMRDYQVDLHMKLVESEENRAHMSASINFKNEAEGWDNLEEYDPSYQETPTPQGSGVTSQRTKDPRGPATCYIPLDIRGEGCVIKDGSTLQQSLQSVCDEYKAGMKTKVNPITAQLKPMKLEVDESIWHDCANAAALRQH
jgi:hypothetical protein